VLLRKLPGPFRSLAYLPRGPFGLRPLSLLPELSDWARARNCIELKVEPHWPTGDVLPRGFSFSKNPVLLARTATLDLSLSEETLLAAATKKTRQYIRKSAKEGIAVREARSEKDIERCLVIYHQTASRAGFGLHVDDYYYAVAKQLGSHSRIFVAEHQGAIVAFLWLAVTPALAFELYGGMDDRGQQLRANYSLKWQAISSLRAEGVALYDMNGLLGEGISAFKLGFTGGREELLLGTLDAPLSPLYGIWEGLLPKARSLIRLLRR
jgi:lipid II:glycine glycyltransferase (peptidoglycan interpeptide bridge formation enzyme)